MKRCPSIKDISAYVDGELPEARRRHMVSHLSQCLACANVLRELEGVRAIFRSFPKYQVGFDLSPSIRARLAAAPDDSGSNRWVRRIFQLMPLSLTVAATMVAGIFIGTLLTVPGKVYVPTGLEGQAMAMFDPVPPGNVCVGHVSCYNRGRL